MEASVRILSPTTLNHHLSRSILSNHFLKFPPNRAPPITFNSPRNPNHPLFTIAFPSYNRLLPRNRSASARIQCASQSSVPSPISNPLSFLLSLSATQLFNTHVSDQRSDRVGFDSKEQNFSWNRAPVNVDGEDVGLWKEKRPVLTVVVLGWLGAEQKHLKRYIQLYTSKGIHAVSMVIPVWDLLAFDSGKRVDKRILSLTDELISWLSETEKDGRERGLLFHTFSNTGWFAYGAILDHLRSRGEFMDKIKGCVIDSGPAAELDPQVWAAGFSAALLKKRSSATLPLAEAIEGDKHKTDKGIPKVQNVEPPLVETLLLTALEKFFSVALKWPDVNRRLTNIISTLSNNPPPCPQLYLYSTGDKVVPFGKVELFIQGQKLLGRKVCAYDFGSSPHVDHYRKFPDVYSAELQKFLKECLTTVVRR